MKRPFLTEQELYGAIVSVGFSLTVIFAFLIWGWPSLGLCVGVAICLVGFTADAARIVADRVAQQPAVTAELAASLDALSQAHFADREDSDPEEAALRVAHAWAQESKGS